MKLLRFAAVLFAASALFVCCQKESSKDDENQGPEKELAVVQLTRKPWYDENPVTAQSQFTVTHEPLRLCYFGTPLDSDAKVEMKFPESTDDYNRAILTYRMGGWNKGPAEWDMTTQIMILNRESGEYYEIARAITPYGGYFDSNWSKEYFLDVTEYLPLLKGDVEFRVYYGGYDATDLNAHTVQMTYNFYKEDKSVARAIYYNKIYDSRYDENGCRGWYYGSSKYPIEDDKFMGLREFTVPTGVTRLLMKVNITGHGMEMGTFPDRPNYKTKNAAEFDENTYEVVINGKNYGSGHIFYNNSKTYKQAGTYWFNRANWGPGLPVNTHFWRIDNLPRDGKMSVDLNLERYISPEEKGAAYYIVQVDVIGMD